MFLPFIQVSISPAGSHHYPNNYTLSYNILGEQTNTITLKGDLLNTTMFELEPDSKYFFKLCAKGANEQDEICANTTVQTKGENINLLIICNSFLKKSYD